MNATVRHPKWDWLQWADEKYLLFKKIIILFLSQSTVGITGGWWSKRLAFLSSRSCSLQIVLSVPIFPTTLAGITEARCYRSSTHSLHLTPPTMQAPPPQPRLKLIHTESARSSYWKVHPLSLSSIKMQGQWQFVIHYAKYAEYCDWPISIEYSVCCDSLYLEYELVHNAFFTDPNDQSSWFYYRWLLGRGVCVLWVVWFLTLN